MQKIPIVMAKPGMVLAQDIFNEDNASGMPICGKGIKLTDSLINRFTQMNIQSISVEGHPVKMEGEASVDEMLAALDKRFSRVADDPLMMKVKALFQKQILRSMGEPDGR
jgi:hypothetical protein